MPQPKTIPLREIAFLLLAFCVPYLGIVVGWILSPAPSTSESEAALLEAQLKLEAFEKEGKDKEMFLRLFHEANSGSRPKLSGSGPTLLDAAPFEEHYGEVALYNELLQVPEVSMRQDPETRSHLLKQTLILPVIINLVPSETRSAERQITGKTAELDPARPLLPKDQLDQLAGLPFVAGKDCRLSATEASALENSARLLRNEIMDLLRRNNPDIGEAETQAYLKKVEASLEDGTLPTDLQRLQAALAQPASATDPGQNPELEMRKNLLKEVEELKTKLALSVRYLPVRETGFPAWMQILQPDNVTARKLLVAFCSRSTHPRCSEYLARLAVIDLSPVVRKLAREALKPRPVHEYQDTLVRYMNYPWPPVTDHAAEALIELQVKQAVPLLVECLREPDASLPRTVEVNGKKQEVLPQLVRINHLKNCAVCHPPSFGPGSQAGSVPDPKKPLLGGSYGATSDLFVRADETYLRPDFSYLQKVKKADPWPVEQRFDFLVRQTPLTAEEAEAARQKYQQTGLSPQRQALLRTLRALTSKDLGTTAEEWQPVLAGG